MVTRRPGCQLSLGMADRGFGLGMAFALSSVLLIAAPGRAWADVRPNPLFSDGAVLQQGKTVPVWGTADDGERVTVTIQGQQAAAVCHGGQWRVDLRALEPGGPLEMTIAGKNTITLHHLQVGEVWVASGQSNMDLTVASCDRAEDEIAHSDHPFIRLCKVPRQAADRPQHSVPVVWRECGRPRSAISPAWPTFLPVTCSRP